MELVDRIFSSFTSVLQGGTQFLLVPGLLVLGLCATIAFYREYAYVLVGGTGVGEALAWLLMFLVGAMLYTYVLRHWSEMTDYGLRLVLHWASLSGASPTTASLLAQPSQLFRAGLVAAKPIADFDNWMKALGSLANFVVSPRDALIFAGICIAFFINAVHFGFMVVEFHMAVLGSMVLVPWGIWHQSRSVAELAIGWVTGCLVRVFVSTIMVGIALPLFALLTPATPASPLSLALEGDVGGALTAIGLKFTGVPYMMPVLDTFVLLGGSVVFCVLCVAIPGRTARLAAGGLDLSGHTLAASVMTTARFGMAFSGVGRPALQAASRMMASRGMARAA